MSREVHELAVRLEAVGGEEARDEISSTSDEFSDTTDELGEQTSILDGFNKKWAGAALVFAGTLGTLSAAVASRMPILEEVAGGIDQVLTSLALAIDEDVRPSLSNLSEDFSDLAEDIDDAEGSAAAIGTALGGAITIALQRLSEREFSVESTVDFAFTVGEVTVEEIDLSDVSVADLGSISVNLTEILQFSVAPGAVIGEEIGERIGETIAEEIQDTVIAEVDWRVTAQDLLTFAVNPFGTLGEILGLMIIEHFRDEMTPQNILDVQQFAFEFLEFARNPFQKLGAFLGRIAAREIANAISSFPGVDIQGPSGPTSTRAAREAFGVRQNAGGDRLTNRLDRLIATLEGPQAPPSVDINGRTVAGAVQAEFGEGVGNRGR